MRCFDVPSPVVTDVLGLIVNCAPASHRCRGAAV